MASDLGAGTVGPVARCSQVRESVPDLPAHSKGEFMALDGLQRTQLFIVEKRGHAVSELRTDSTAIGKVVSLRGIGMDEGRCASARQIQHGRKACREGIGAVAELSYECAVDLGLEDSPSRAGRVT